MRTQLELVSSGVVDLYDDIPISLTYSIADIENPDQRNAVFSKTITLPGTLNNNNLFKHIYEIDIYSNFNPNAKALINLYDNNVLVLEGYLKLNNIIVLDEKKEYEVVIYGNVANVFLDMGESLLQDLDFSDLDHVYNGANVEASWSATVGNNYVYPLIDYGYSNTTNAGLGETATEDYKPAIYVKEYIDRIFSTRGYTYSSPFFESDFFKRLIIPYTGGALKLTESEVQSRLYSVEATSNTITNTVPATQWIYQNVDITSEFYDYSNQVDTTGNSVTIAYTGTYTFTINIIGYSYTQLTANTYSRLYVNIYRYRSDWTGGGIFYQVDAIGAGIGSFTSQAVRLDAGDHIVYTLSAYNIQSATIGNMYLSNSLVTDLISEGNTIFMNRAVPRNIKQKDFFMSILKMFNMYVDRDKNQSKKYIIEPRNDFYSSGTVVDWDSLVDYSKPIEITPTTDKIVAKYIYRYKSDGDYYNSIYQSRYSGEPYGTKNYYSNNDLLKGEKVTEVIFSPTPTVYKLGRYMACIAAQNGGGASTEFNIRILYYAGLVTAPFDFFFNTVRKSYYPQATHTDNPNTPYRDLSFGAPKEVYYQATRWTNQTLFSMFHYPQIGELTSQHARIINAYVKLRPTDILSLDFRSIFYFGGHYLRLLSIEEYSPGLEATYKCSFLKLKYKDIPHSSNYTITTPETFGTFGYRVASGWSIWVEGQDFNGF